MRGNIRLTNSGLQPFLFERICFTVITVPSEDLAFTFFDTQNNRGVPLNATDLLKAYHLRAITGDGKEHLQTYCAEHWERMQGSQQILGQGVDFAPLLFHHFLWRARRWTGQKLIARETHDDIIDEFQKQTVLTKSADNVPLYSSRNNRLAVSLTLFPQTGYSLVRQPIQMSHQATELPFAIRQPISQGVGFFLYASKYAALTEALLDKNSIDPQVKAFQDFYERVVASLSIYLRELFLLSCVMFVDQFGTEDLLCFALWLDHVLGAIRLEKQYIFKEAPLIYLRDSSHNLLDVIAGAFRPEQVIEHLKRDANANKVYATESVETGTGVQGSYKQRVLEYFGKQGSLKDKSKWIEERFV